MISKEDMEALRGYEHQFRTAIESGYARHFGSRAYAALNEIYKRITGSYYSVNYGCSYCAMKFVKALGKLYFEELDRLAQEEQEETVDDKSAETELTTPKTVTPYTEEQAVELLEVLDEIFEDVPDDETRSIPADEVQTEPEPKVVTPSVSEDKPKKKTIKATNKKQNKK